MANIQTMREEAGLIENEEIMKTLRQASFRVEIIGEASKRVEISQFKQVFNDIKRDDELQAIVRMLLPNKMTLLNNTVTY
jgi:2-methylisocitrate lyase-like PEP mutase family enzyme